MAVIEGIENRPDGGPWLEAVRFETPSHGRVGVVICPEHQQIVGFAIHDTLRDVFLTAQGIQRHQDVCQHQTVQQFRP